ncbi:right-handed parallel beta-helix repeat-containing protein [Chryseosolibacter indicus]|uniref:Right-handed parallel beta-helix repeat-containing protein n=1 Tax=Chryseosolibacter indicus TaxID=2782351 RepID=A0ABS5VXB4_9BACT|nr:right-handed parallel beta-helix repeat-containing protein [Chryseosolibacter indicus]MBT1705698.1 right-handed parallel beta-helix repeat-containing protein [Chryseosolibacter indicus]
MKPHFILNAGKRISVVLILLSLFFQCSEDESLLKTEESINDITISATATAEISPASCNCTYIVPGNLSTVEVDGTKLGLKPGAVICLNAANKYQKVFFKNLVGTASAPILITNCGGTATLNAPGHPYTMKTEDCKFIKIAGGTGTSRGIKITGGHMGLVVGKLTTNVEVQNLEIFDVGFAGIIAKTDPTCDDATIRENFVMRDVSIHDNYVHDTGGEALYIGHSFYYGVQTSCGLRLPHLIDGLKIYNNKIVNSGWESIQVGCALNGAYVYNNTIENYGVVNEPAQNNGIQFSAGTKGFAYNNLIKSGKGIGIMVIGHGEATLHDNVIIGTGSFGIFCDERDSRAAGYKILNNTIINTASDGIRMYNDYVPAVVYNNIVVNPGTYSTYTYPRTGDDAYVYKLGKTIPVTMSNNLFTRDINTVKFVNPSAANYRITTSSPAVNTGKDIRSYNIDVDFYQQSRLSGSAYDIGASELVGASSAPITDGKPENSEDIEPVANSGKDITVDLPVGSVVITGNASDSDGKIVSYKWTKVRGPESLSMSGTNTAKLTVSKLVEGAYVFRLTVTDDDGNSDYDDMLLKVNP